MPFYIEARGRNAISVLAVLACLAVIFTTARIGFSRIMSTYANLTASTEAADLSVRLAPGDPEAHRARGAVLQHLGRPAEAAANYEKAVSLRPFHAFLWTELGIVREESGDQAGALEAADEAVRRAPFYAVPRWQRGNLLLRMGRYQEGFADLRVAADSDRHLLPNLFDLAWGLSQGNLPLISQVLQIKDNETRLAWARFLARKGRGQEALELVRQVGTIPDPVRKEIVSHLIAQKEFKRAFELWSGDRKSDPLPSVFDGGFETPLSFDETGFGWRVAGGESLLNFSIDQAEKHTGAKSLRIQFNGNLNPSGLLVSQFILVEGQKRYRLNFASRTKELLTGGLPYFVIADPENQSILGKSELIREGSSEWVMQTLDFASGPNAQAMLLALRREPCAADPCPVFGLLWLDSFSLETLPVK